ncbi:hypothetical protein B9Z65_4053 [Elsinoe australis]|uniref:Importin N-terminal domain-containing protein n=1 Tax=Elsinoe australis TaxID=40998 RepID=A0A2P7Z1Q1_9PEZI|nr:hypothetical protein B9Z65_4053 [Elsinoe australis]
MAATNGGGGAYAPILSALQTMQSNVDRNQKDQAHQYLEHFQKSSESWTTVFDLLSASEASSEAKLFAATTLKGKIIYDLHQLPKEATLQLRDSTLSLLSAYTKGPKPIRTQLCVCLANLAIQMLEWKDVLSTVVGTLGSDANGIPTLMEFLRVLPEEVTEGRKINLTEDELRDRTIELLEENGTQVLSLLKQYAQTTGTAANEPYFLECVTSWIREIPLQDIVQSPLMDVIMASLEEGAAMDAGVECLCAMFRETRDVDETLEIIKILYPQIMSLRPRIAQAASEEDAETLKLVTRVLAEAGEAWVVLISRMPNDFRALVEAILECAAADKDKEAISLTFIFWYELKQYLTLERYMEARATLADVYSKLVDIMIGHLEFPRPEGSNPNDLFDGDREAEERFREFRHQMGDVLKDCCEVIGVTECLQKSYMLIEQWVNTNGQQASQGNVPDWQKLEAPIFSMRAMGRMVPPDESIMLPRLIPLLIQIPDQEKVRFQAVMALGRYTEWTAQHPETLEQQLNFIMAAFHHQSKEVRTAAALSFRFFCNDCANLLKDFVGQLQQFYESVINTLPSSSQEEITEGVASVIAKLPPDQTYQMFKMTCDPVVSRLMEMAKTATEEPAKLAVADHLQLVTIFIQWIQPPVQPGQSNPAVQYCQEIFPTLSVIAENFTNFVPILERVCRCWRHMVLSYRTSMAPLLPELATRLADGFQKSRQGCFLWATDSIVREFTEEAGIDQGTSASVFDFFDAQATNFFKALNDLPPEELPDGKYSDEEHW